VKEKEKKRGRGQPFGSRKFTPEEIDKKIEEFFEFCKTENKPVTITRLARFIECDRDTLRCYKKDKNTSGSIKKALAACQEYAEDRLFTHQQCTGAIFTLKNNYGWRDVKEVEGGITVLYNIIGCENMDKPDDAGTSKNGK